MSIEEIYTECSGAHKFVFLSLAYAEGAILALFGMVLAYKTQKHFPKQGDLYECHEPAVINLTTMLTILISSICEAVLIILQLNQVKDGVLLVITLRDCIWMYPMLYVLFAPKVCI